MVPTVVVLDKTVFIPHTVKDEHLLIQDYDSGRFILKHYFVGDNKRSTSAAGLFHLI